MYIDTPRLRLRRIQQQDKPELSHLLSDWTLVEHLAFVPWPFDEKAAESYIEEMSRHDGKIGHYAITRIEDEKLIGVLGVDDVGGGPEIDYWLGTSFWNKGYASEAVTGVINYLFREQGFNSILAFVAPDNVASQKMLEKLKFRYCGDAQPSPDNLRPPPYLKKYQLKNTGPTA